LDRLEIFGVQVPLVKELGSQSDRGSNAPL
jgi:hypothetical protein